MTVYLVRHARAEGKNGFSGPDARRPLDTRGWKQAEGLAELLADRGIERIVSSPRDRCVQTVQPLADRLGIAVETDPTLDFEPLDIDAAMKFLLSTADSQVAHCTHREIIAEVMQRLAQEGLVDEGDLAWGKGSVWVLEADAGRFVRGRYLPPQA